ncbi:MAG: prepilin-type N-terminal cleavage/methylation domain-containing protein [Elainellaceae cyanobacterium]
MTYLTRSIRRLSQINAAQTNVSEQGLTLIECIVAIAVIAVTGAVIAPPLLLATATRLQNQRAEQALQIAQGEIDRVQTLVNRNRQTTANLPVETSEANLSDQDAPGSSSDLLKSVNATSSCSTYDETTDQIAVDEVLEIDMDGDCETDFLMQSFRGDSKALEGGDPSDFELMVRVYAAGAADNFGSLGTDPASLRFTSGEGNQRERPLAVLTTRIIQSDLDNSLSCYHHNTADCLPPS